jgi:integrase
MASNHIYSIDRDVQVAISRIRDMQAPEQVKEKIIEFVSFVKEANGIGPHREYFYYSRLQQLALLMQDKLLNPSRKDVIQAIAQLRSTRTNRKTMYSPASISDFKKVLKKFVKYVNDGELPKFWSDIHAEKIGPRYDKPDEMITYDELQALVKACRNPRDKAMISLLWDSGVRASELLLLKCRDFQKSPDALYATLNVEIGSKTYKHRTIVLTGDSVVRVSEWLQERDFKPDDPLFIGIGKEKPGQPLTYDDLRTILRKVVARSGLRKQISPHLFRHSAATRLATENIPMQVFVKQMGWASNRMADNYTHLDNKGQIIAILQSQGIEITDDELNKPITEILRRCPRCRSVNTGGARFCSNCGSPMKAEDYLKIEARKQEALAALKESEFTSPIEADLLKGASPEFEEEWFLKKLEKLDSEGKLSHLFGKIKARESSEEDGN